MTALKQPIEFTLERVADLVGDPSERVYARLFGQYPHYEDLFALDTDGGVRANMLHTSLMCLLGMAEGADTPKFLLEAAQIQHEGYGLTDADMAAMFTVMRDEFRAILGAEWTPDLEAAWVELLAQLAALNAALSESDAA